MPHPSPSFRRFLPLIFLFNLLTFPARADYGWLPDYQKLIVKAGFDYYRTSQNFDEIGQLSPPVVNRQAVQLSDFRFWAEPEYGIAEDWSLLARVGFVTTTVDSQNTGDNVLEGMGLADLRAGLKYSIKTSMPILTLETTIKVPASPASAGPGEVVVGDGNFDLGLILHTGHRSGKFLFALSPGLVARFGGYSSAGTANIAVQLEFPKGYIRAYTLGVFSFSATPLFDSDLKTHDAPGSGGSYARLNGSPIGLSGGGKIGLYILKNWTLEAGLEHAIFGTRYPNYFDVTLNVVGTFDFFKPDVRKKVREIPLDSTDEKFYPN